MKIKHPMFVGVVLGYMYGVTCLTLGIPPIVCGIPFAVAYWWIEWRHYEFPEGD